MRRRTFIAALGGAAAWPVVTRGQQPERVRHIGVLFTGLPSDPQVQRFLQALLRGLQELGWTADVNLKVDARYGNNDGKQILTIAKELVATQPDLIEVMTTPGVAALLKETRTIPVVFTTVSDPIGAGFVESFAHPGRNVTGFVNIESSMGGKWVQILKEVAPNVTRVTLLFNPSTGPQVNYYRGPVEDAARVLSISIRAAPAEDAATVESEIFAAARDPNAGLIVLPDIFTFTQRELIASSANRVRLPAVYPFPEFAPMGGLICYGVDNVDAQRRAASGLIHTDDSQIAGNSSSSRHESRNCRGRYPSGPPST